jgi:signal transduction histidine kinase/CheY-like chemotaxis protein
MRFFSQLIGTALFIAAVQAAPSRSVQSPLPTRRILVLYWYGRDVPSNVEFADRFQTAIRSAAPGPVEVYSEYLESNRFPGENQRLVLRDYLRDKYADRKIDVVIANGHVCLGFLLEFRDSLFSDTPIVFSSIRTPSVAEARAGAGATGIVYMQSQRKTLDLALTLHPDTQQLFVISGTTTRDKQLESDARKELQEYQSRLAITYLTDLPLGELVARIRTVPQHSIILYLWQQIETEHSTVESPETLAAVANAARAPLYGLTSSNVGRGIVGGYVATVEGNVATLAALGRRIANGARPADIPVQTAPVAPMFDWRQLKRWNIPENRLPPGSIVRFREPTMWQQYKSTIIAAIVLFLFQAFLIGALLVERGRARRSRRELEQYKGHLENLVQERTAELVEARDQAVAANRSKSTFLAHMSHELRTPMNAILGFTAMVLRDRTLPEKHRKDLAIVGRSGEHLLGLIDEVLDMAKIETGAAAVDLAPVDLHDLVTDAVTFLRERAKSKNLELLLDISSRTPQFVRTDERKVRQLLTNLLANALKYTDEGGVAVRVDARPDDDGSRTRILIEVEDTGIGIAPEDLARIFDPFVQIGGARSRQGTGLGLSITRHFVNLLGGTVAVESAVDRGSKFTVAIPVSLAGATEVRPSIGDMEHVIGLAPGQPEYRILIVEDRKENWVILQRFLDAAGFQVLVAEDGQKGVELFSSWRPHFIWMDVRLPVFSGIEAAKRIRQLPGGRDVKIAAVTASAFASERDAVLAAGFDDFLRKPYRPQEIFDCMARRLGVRYVHAAAAPEPDPALSGPLRPAALAALPETVLDDLENAVISLESTRISQVIKTVSQHDAALAQSLERLAEALAYSPILTAVRSGRNGGGTSGIASAASGSMRPRSG